MPTFFSKIKNKKYMTVCLYIFAVAAAVSCVLVGALRFNQIKVLFSRVSNVLWITVIGFSIAYILNSFVRFAETIILPRLKKKRRRVARILALIFTYFVALLIFAVLLFMIVPQIVLNYESFVASLSGHLMDAVNSLVGFLRSVPAFAAWGDSLYNLIEKEELTTAIVAWVSGFANQIGSFGLQIITTTGHVLAGIALSAYFLYHKEYIAAACKKILLALFPQKFGQNVIGVFRYADEAFGRFIVGKLFDSLIVGLITFIALAIVGMPYYPLISAIMCITSIIPAIGPIIGAVPSFFIIWVSSPIMAFWFLLIALIIQQLDGNIIGPKIVGSATGLSSVWVITAIMLTGAFLGPIGWLIGVPLFSVLYRVLGDISNRRLQKKNMPISLEYYEKTPLARVAADACDNRGDIPKETEETAHEQ